MHCILGSKGTSRVHSDILFYFYASRWQFHIRASTRNSRQSKPWLRPRLARAEPSWNPHLSPCFRMSPRCFGHELGKKGFSHWKETSSYFSLLILLFHYSIFHYLFIFIPWWIMSVSIILDNDSMFIVHPSIYPSFFQKLLLICPMKINKASPSLFEKGVRASVRKHIHNPAKTM